MLTQARLKELLHYDPKLGWFMWLVDRGRTAKAGSTAGYLEGGRLRIEIAGRQYWAGPLIWFYVTGSWPKGQVDHRSTDPLDNRWRNLRDVTPAINGQNKRRAKAGSRSQLLGVNAAGRSWRAQIFVGGKNRHLGCFATPLAAHRAYVKAKRLHHEGCTL